MGLPETMYNSRDHNLAIGHWSAMCAQRDECMEIDSEHINALALREISVQYIRRSKEAGVRNKVWCSPLSLVPPKVSPAQEIWASSL